MTDNERLLLRKKVLENYPMDMDQMFELSDVQLEELVGRLGVPGSTIIELENTRWGHSSGR